MDSAAGSATVYCHECHHQWPQRSEHDIICPHCDSNFVEVVEGNTQDDPRDDALHIGGLGDLSSGMWPSQSDDDGEAGRNNSTGHTLFGGSHDFWNMGSAVGRGTGSYPEVEPRPNAPAGSALPGALGGIFGILHSALGGPTHPSAAADSNPSSRSYTWNSPSGNAHFSMTTSSSTFTNGRPTTPGDASGFLNDMFSVPISPGGTRGVPPAFGFPGTGAAGDPITLLDILMGGRFGAPGQYAHSQEEFDRIISDIMERTQAGSGAPGATEDTISSLPQKKADRSMLGDTGKAECTICMAEVSTGEVVTELYCKHWFHTDCIKVWLEQHNTCPHCRKSVEEAKRESEAKQYGPPQADGTIERSGRGDSESDRKRVRRSRSSQQETSRRESASRDSHRMPGAFPSPGSFLRSSSFATRETSRNSEVNPQTNPASFRSSTHSRFSGPRETFRRLSSNHGPQLQASAMPDAERTSRLQDTFRRRPSHPTTPPRNHEGRTGSETSPRRSRSFGPSSDHPRTLHAGFQEHMNETARHIPRVNGVNQGGGLSGHHARNSPTRRSSDVDLARHRVEQQEQARGHDESPGLLSRARDWLGGR